MVKSKTSKIISIFLAVLVFLADTVFLDAREANFWKEREKSLQLAGLITTPPELSGFRVPNFAFNPLQIKPGSALGSSKFETRLAANLKNLSILKPLSTAYGTVRKITKSKTKMSGPVVVHIQDVHMNPEAQANIGKAVAAMIDQQKVDLIAIEGAAGPIDFSPFKNYPYQDSLRKVVDQKFKQQKLSGPIYAGFTAQKSLPIFVGIDDREHYTANVEAYRKSVAGAPQKKLEISNFETAVDAQKVKVFNSKLEAFDSKIEAYHKGQHALASYLRLLINTAPNEADNLNIETFLSAYDLQSSLNFTQVESECSKLLSKLINKLDKDESFELMNMSVAYRAGEITNTHFYNDLRDLSEKNGIQLRKFPLMNSYMQFILLSDSIDSERLFIEAKNLENAIYASLAKSDEEKLLIAQSRYIFLADKLVNFGMTKDEWIEYKGLPRDNQNDARIDLSAFEQFYEEADIRDRLMAENLQKAAKEYNAKNIVLITGGYHAWGIEKALVSDEAKSFNYTVASFIPKITKVENENGLAYLSIFTQEKTPLEKFFEGQKLSLAPPSMTLPFRETVAFETVSTDLAAHRSINAYRQLIKLVPDGLIRVKKIIGSSNVIKFLVVNISNFNCLINVKLKNGIPDGDPSLEPLGVMSVWKSKNPWIYVGLMPFVEELIRYVFNSDGSFLGVVLVYSICHAMAHFMQDWEETRDTREHFLRIGMRTLISAGFGLYLWAIPYGYETYQWTGFIGSWLAHSGWNYLAGKYGWLVMSTLNRSRTDKAEPINMPSSHYGRLGISPYSTPDQIENGYRATIENYFNVIWDLGDEFDPDRKELNKILASYSTLKTLETREEYDLELLSAIPVAKMRTIVQVLDQKIQLPLRGDWMDLAARLKVQESAIPLLLMQTGKFSLYRTPRVEKQANSELDFALVETLVTLRRLREEDGRLNYLTKIEILKGLVLEKGILFGVEKRMNLKQEIIKKHLSDLNIPDAIDSAPFRQDLAREVVRRLAPSFNEVGGEASLPTEFQIRAVLLESVLRFPNRLPEAAKWAGLSLENYKARAKELNVSLAPQDMDQEFLRNRIVDSLLRFPNDLEKAAKWALVDSDLFQKLITKFKIKLDTFRSLKSPTIVFDDPDSLKPQWRPRPFTQSWFDSDNPWIILVLAPIIEEGIRMVAEGHVGMIAAFAIFPVLHALGHIYIDRRDSKSKTELGLRLLARVALSTGFGVAYWSFSHFTGLDSWTGMFASTLVHSGWNYLAMKFEWLVMSLTRSPNYESPIEMEISRKNVAELRGKSIKQASDYLNITRKQLSGYLRYHPEKFSEWRLVDDSIIQARINFNLDELKGLSFEQIAALIRIDPQTLFFHLARYKHTARKLNLIHLVKPKVFTWRVSNPVKNPFNDLGVPVFATKKEIFSAYKKLVRLYYPAKLGQTPDPKFFQIQAAYDAIDLEPKRYGWILQILNRVKYREEFEQLLEKDTISNYDRHNDMRVISVSPLEIAKRMNWEGEDSAAIQYVIGQLIAGVNVRRSSQSYSTYTYDPNIGDPDDLLPNTYHLSANSSLPRKRALPPPSPGYTRTVPTQPIQSEGLDLEHLEWAAIQAALIYNNGHRIRATEQLGISRAVLYKKLERSLFTPPPSKYTLPAPIPFPATYFEMEELIIRAVTAANDGNVFVSTKRLGIGRATKKYSNFKIDTSNALLPMNESGGELHTRMNKAAEGLSYVLALCPSALQLSPQLIQNIQAMSGIQVISRSDEIKKEIEVKRKALAIPAEQISPLPQAPKPTWINWEKQMLPLARQTAVVVAHGQLRRASEALGRNSQSLHQNARRNNTSYTNIPALRGDKPGEFPCTLDELKELMIRVSFGVNNGNKLATAQMIGIGRQTVYDKIHELTLNPDHSLAPYNEQEGAFYGRMRRSIEGLLLIIENHPEAFTETTPDIYEALFQISGIGTPKEKLGVISDKTRVMTIFDQSEPIMKRKLEALYNVSRITTSGTREHSREYLLSALYAAETFLPGRLATSNHSRSVVVRRATSHKLAGLLRATPKQLPIVVEGVQKIAAKDVPIQILVDGETVPQYRASALSWITIVAGPVIAYLTLLTFFGPSLNQMVTMLSIILFSVAWHEGWHWGQMGFQLSLFPQFKKFGITVNGSTGDPGIIGSFTLFISSLAAVYTCPSIVDMAFFSMIVNLVFMTEWRDWKSRVNALWSIAPEYSLAGNLFNDVEDAQEGYLDRVNMRPYISNDVERKLARISGQVPARIEPSFVKFKMALENHIFKQDKLHDVFMGLLKSQIPNYSQKIKGWLQTVFMSELGMEILYDVMKRTHQPNGVAVVIINDEMTNNTLEMNNALNAFMFQTQLGMHHVLLIPASEKTEEKVRRYWGYHTSNIVPFSKSSEAFTYGEDGEPVEVKLAGLEQFITPFDKQTSTFVSHIVLPRGVAADPTGVSEQSSFLKALLLFVFNGPEGHLCATTVAFSFLKQIYELNRLILQQA